MATERVQVTNAQAQKAFDWLKQYALDNPKCKEASHAVIAWANAVNDRNAYKMLLVEPTKK